MTSTPAGIDCGAACSVSRTVTRSCLDDDCGPWPEATAFTLGAAGGPAGYSASWTGCGTTPSCTVQLGDAETGGEFRTVALSWVDTTAPTTAFAPPAKVGPSNFSVVAGATDNSGAIARYAWTVDGVTQVATGSVLSLAGAAHGDHTVAVRSFDGAGNASAVVSRTVAVDKVAGVSPAALPAVTNAETVPFTVRVRRRPPHPGAAAAVVVPGPRPPLGRREGAGAAAGRARGAGELARALGQQERQLAGRVEGVGDRVAVVERVGGPEPASHLRDEHDPAGRRAGVEVGEVQQRQRVIGARVADGDGGARDVRVLCRAEQLLECSGGSHGPHTGPEPARRHRAFAAT